MVLTERQIEILNSIVEEYIDSAEPVSSKLLEKKYDFEICPATIRIEMQKLTDNGFISQPHVSAGRVPTDRGYRYFVDELLKENIFKNETEAAVENLFTEEAKEYIRILSHPSSTARVVEDTVKFIQLLTKSLANASSNLVLGYLPDEKILWKEGWEEILSEPEFQERGIIDDFSKVIKNFEEMVSGMELDSDISIFIGRENPFKKSKEFTTIITKCKFPKRQEGILAILGPKRMSYKKNINSLNSLVKTLKEL